MRSIGEIQNDIVANEMRDFMDWDLHWELRSELREAQDAEPLEARAKRLAEDRERAARALPADPSMLSKVNHGVTSIQEIGALVVAVARPHQGLYVVTEVVPTGTGTMGLTVENVSLPGVRRMDIAPLYRLATPEEIAAVMPALKHAAE